MNFEHTTLLWLLSVIPLMVIAFIIRQRLKRKQLQLFADNAMLPRLQPDISTRRPVIKLILLCLGVGMLIIAWANPRIGSKIAEGEQKGIDMAVCIDVSNSMLAQDMKPNRMARTKQVVQNLISQLGGDRVSLVVFAGNAFIEMPVTNDYGATINTSAKDPISKRRMRKIPKEQFLYTCRKCRRTRHHGMHHRHWHHHRRSDTTNRRTRPSERLAERQRRQCCHHPPQRRDAARYRQSRQRHLCQRRQRQRRSRGNSKTAAHIGQPEIRCRPICLLQIAIPISTGGRTTFPPHRSLHPRASQSPLQP